ncbi:MAG: chromosome segregation protein SMC [Clostridiales bacterium]|nr:chromosome segregation protein SMC [Clostridiales bacterium]
MVLKKLEMYGFKSFADRIEIEFDKGITAIVGPNGSGKSNVADAIRWVLGEQSAKSLRGGRMEDIIFSGTQVRKPLGFAEVSLTLDNSDHVLPIDFTEVTITRRVFRSGESEYYINRSSCRLKDIIELFMDTGVGKEGYSIIGQGKVEEIISAQSENRRLVFEEAAGIIKYRTRKQESERKLQNTQENIIRVEDILGEIENRLKPLEQQSNAAKEYLSLRDKLKVYDLNKFILEYDSHKNKAERIKETTDSLDRDILNHRKVISEHELEVTTLKERLELLDNEIQSLREDKYSALNEIEKFKGKTKVLKERISHLDSEKSRLEDEIREKKQEADELKDQKLHIIEALKSENKILQEKLSCSADLEARLSEIQKALSVVHTEARHRKEELAEAQKALGEAGNKTTRFQAIKEGIGKQVENNQLQIEELAKTKAGLVINYRTKTDYVKTLRQALSTYKEEKTTFKKKAGELEKRLNGLENIIQSKKRKLESDRSRLNVLSEMSSAYEGYHRGVKDIMLAARKNESIKERVCGVVAELIDVPKGFEAAMETALGSSLQHIVTHDEQDAKFLIDFLKHGKLGRATFLPISSLRGRGLNKTEQSALTMEGCLGRGTDIIGFDSEYWPVFNYLLGRVVITENLDQAIEMAKRFSHSFRIVTLAGDVINAGGSITGGSIFKGKTDIIGRSKEIEGLKASISKVANEVEITIKDKDVLLTELSLMNQNVKTISHRIHELEVEFAAEKERLEGISLQMKKMDREIQDLNETKARLQLEKAAMLESIQEQEQLIDGLKERCNSLRVMADSTDISVEDSIKEKDRIEQQLTKLKVEIAGIQHKVYFLEERQVQLNKELKSYSTDIKEKLKKLDENSESMVIYKQKIAGYSLKTGSLNEKVLKFESLFEGKQSEKTALNENAGNIESRVKNLRSVVEDLGTKRNNMEIQLSRAEAEIDNTQNNIWEEYQVSYGHALKYRDESLSITQIRKGIQEIKERINSLGTVNVNAVEEYRLVRERYQFLTRQKEDLIKAKEDLNEIIRGITATMKEKFIGEFAIINRHFGQVFSRLFGGGKAELVLEDPDDVLASGVEIVAQPPGKKLQSISLLSGGEKALTAISILFAILERKPTSFCVLDEIEAALDDQNIQSFGQFLTNLSERTQFVMITHRRGTMEVSDVLYGVAMEEKGVSRMISVRLEDEMAS